MMRLFSFQVVLFLLCALSRERHRNNIYAIALASLRLAPRRQKEACTSVLLTLFKHLEAMKRCIATAQGHHKRGESERFLDRLQLICWFPKEDDYRVRQSRFVGIRALCTSNKNNHIILCSNFHFKPPILLVKLCL